MGGGRRKKIISETSKSLQSLKKLNLANKETFTRPIPQGCKYYVKGTYFFINPSRSSRFIIIN